MIRKVVSGGQTGVDRAALDAALERRIPVGGWCPAGRRSEDGPIDAHYPLRETPTSNYAQRTAWNVRDSDGTLILLRTDPIGGTRTTVNEAIAHERPYLILHLGIDKHENTLHRRLTDWLAANKIETLNVAGPRESEEPGVYELARGFLDDFLERWTDARRSSK